MILHDALKKQRDITNFNSSKSGEEDLSKGTDFNSGGGKGINSTGWCGIRSQEQEIRRMQRMCSVEGAVHPKALPLD